MTTITTLQVRAVMAQHGADQIYTNKTKGHTGNTRRVKCYYQTPDMHTDLLKLMGGNGNIKMTRRNGNIGRGSRSVIVTCVLA